MNVNVSLRSGKDAEWKSVAYGAPCIQLMRETTKHNCPFHIKIVIAEVESGNVVSVCVLVLTC